MRKSSATKGGALAVVASDFAAAYKMCSGRGYPYFLLGKKILRPGSVEDLEGSRNSALLWAPPTLKRSSI